LEDVLRLCRSVQVFEDVTGIQKLGIDVLGSDELSANDEDFCGFVTRGLWFGGFDGLEELVEHPQQGIVILRSEHLRHERSSYNSNKQQQQTAMQL